MIVISLAVAAAAPDRVAAQAFADLRANLVVSDSRILIYGGMDRGLTAGMKFAVVRNNKQIGTIEIIEVRNASSIARVLTKMEDLRDNDLLAPLTGAEAVPSGRLMKGGMPPAPLAPVMPDGQDAKLKLPGAPSGAAPAASEKTPEANPEKDGKDAGEKETKKTSSASKSSEKKTSSRSSSRSSAKSGSEEKEEAAAGAEAEKPASKKPAGRSSRSSAKKSDEAPAADGKTAAQPKKHEKPQDPRYYAFPTDTGYSGLWTIPNSDIIPKGNVSFSYYHGWYDTSSKFNRVTATGFDSIGSYYDSETSDFSMTYGLGSDVEMAVSRNTMDYEYALSALGSTPPDYSERVSGGGDGWAFGLKYNPRKKFLLEETTNKKWSAAFGAQRLVFEETEGHKAYMVVSLPYEKFDFHVGLFHYNMQGLEGKKLGSMAGIEVPLSRSLELLGEAELFKADYTYNFALRYIHEERYSLLLGLADATDLRIKEVGLSVTY